MHGYIPRKQEHRVHKDLQQFPAVAILGPRQCGKSTTAQEIGKIYPNFIYLDLERPSDQRKIREPELFFNANPSTLICLDEIQHSPNIFPVLRSIIDQRKGPGQFLILGSASRDLLQQSSETLAGRIVYNELSPFLHNELNEKLIDIHKYWLRGGFPRSTLADHDEESFRWRENFIRTYLERDIPQMGFRIPAERMQRLWTMCAHYHGQVLNASAMANALSISSTTVRAYLDILEQTFTVRLLPPFFSNTKKRLVKSPKLYIRDNGIVHALLEIRTINDVFGHPQVGASWEGLVMENIIATLPEWRPSFYRTANGAEIDLILEQGQRRLAFECKVASNPIVSRGFYSALRDVRPEHAWIVVPEGGASSLGKNVSINSLCGCLEELLMFS